MSRAQRLINLLQLLRQHRFPVTGMHLAAELGISVRTLYRDIRTLQEQGAHIDLHPTFAMFTLNSSVMLGLWSKHTAEPTAKCIGGGGEVAFSVENQAAVDALYQNWTNQGLTVAQKPVMMDFGYTFVVLDPDQHRLRVFAPLQS